MGVEFGIDWLANYSWLGLASALRAFGSPPANFQSPFGAQLVSYGVGRNFHGAEGDFQDDVTEFTRRRRQFSWRRSRSLVAKSL